jgi:hypothetical protein
MYLYHIEYMIQSNGQTFTCKIIGESEKEIVKDIESQVGKIEVYELYFQTEIHRITRSIREKIIEQSLIKKQVKREGRPRKFEIMGE